MTLFSCTARASRCLTASQPLPRAAAFAALPVSRLAASSAAAKPLAAFCVIQRRNLSSESATPEGSEGLAAESGATPAETIATLPAKYSDDALLLGKLARFIMRDGKLSIARNHIAECVKTIQDSTRSPPLPIIRKSLEIASPMVRVVNVKKGFKAQPTPIALNEKQQLREGFTSILESSKSRKGTVGQRLAQEMLAVVGGQSEAIKKKERRHAEAVRVRAAIFMR